MAHAPSDEGHASKEAAIVAPGRCPLDGVHAERTGG